MKVSFSRLFRTGSEKTLIFFGRRSGELFAAAQQQVSLLKVHAVPAHCPEQAPCEPRAL